jgi:glycosyltransferase involved in cell wall biosynthesis
MVASQQKTNIDEPIHVLHVASGDLWAGAEVMLYTLTKTLFTKFDVRVTVVLLNAGTLEQKLRGCGIPVHIIDESEFNSIQIIKQLNKIISNTKPDVIHTHRIKENILGSIAAWRKRIPSIRTTHGAPEHRPPLYKLPKRLIFLLDWFLGRFYQRYIIVVSYDLAKKLEHNYQPSKIKVIENGIDIDSLTKNAPQKHTKAVKKNNYRIGIAGRLVPVKRVDLFIQAAVNLKQHNPELSIDFHIYGDGPLHDVLQNQVQSQHAGSYIHFEGHCDSMSQELQKLDALVMTSDHEGLPMILLEAMCQKVPVIAHAVGGIPHLLNQGKCGVLVEDHSPEAFAEAIIRLTDNPEQCQEMTGQAFKRIEQLYSARHTTSHYLDTYKEIIR